MPRTDPDDLDVSSTFVQADGLRSGQHPLVHTHQQYRWHRSASIFGFVLVLPGCATTLAPVAGELAASVGPVELPAAAADHSHADMTEKIGRWRVAEAGWITSFTPAMEDGDGNALPPELLHHVAIADRGRRDPLCTDHPHRMPQLLLAAGAEMTRVELPEGYGIPVDKGAKLVGMGMFGPSPTGPSSDARFVAHMGFVAKRPGAELKPIVPVWIDVLASCPEDGYPISGARDVKTRELSFPFAGELHLAGGHMHDGGRSLVLTRVSDGAEVVRFEPTYEGERITAIPIARFTPPVLVDPGERYRLEAVYEGMPHHGGNGMGIVVAYVAPASAK